MINYDYNPRKSTTFRHQARLLKPKLTVGSFLASWPRYQAKFLGGLVLGFLIWAIYVLFTTPQFFVYGVTVQGHNVVSELEIYKISEVHQVSAFWLNPAQVAQRIEALPNVKSATVSVALPAEVTISIVERNPEFVWQVNNEMWWVDSEGTIVPPRIETSGMFRIVDEDAKPVTVGDTVDPTIIRGAQILRRLVPGLTTVSHSRAKGLTVSTPEGWPVYLGDGGQIQQKLTSLAALRRYIEVNQIEPKYLDLRDPLQPVYEDTPRIQIQQPLVEY